ncbi:MAG: helix-turn-helix transcriptional regulator [Nitrospira sp.]|nr:helix-turn-helix transcriptional regulator [Nitrospira sp.]
MKTNREYIKEQMKKHPKFAEDVAEADREVAIAVELAKLREQRGLSQAQLAQLAGMKQPQIARLESGAYFPAIGTLIRLLAALGGKIELGPNECRVIRTPRKVAALR